MKALNLILVLSMASMGTSRIVEREPRVNFANYHVLEVTANTVENMEMLREMDLTSEEATSGAVDFWTLPVHPNEKATVSIHPELVQPVTKFFDMHNITYNVMVSDLQSLIDNELEKLFESDQDEGLNFRDPSKSYYEDKKFNRLNQITMHMSELQQQYPHLMTLRSIGTTSEGRSIEMAVLSTQPNTRKDVIFVECGIHAREWISPSFCMYTLKRLLSEGSSGMLNAFDFFIVPNTNPDGYEYSWNTNRMWRKNRRAVRGAGYSNKDATASTKQFWGQFPGFGQPGQQQQFGWQPQRPNSPGVASKCRGVDPNRNFEADFGGAGTSTRSCDDTYRGTHAFSEAESMAIKNIVTSTQASGQRIMSYISVHAYSQYWMFPYGYQKTRPSDYRVLDALSRKATAALRSSYGTSYKHGPINEVIYQASGSSVDWIYDSAGIAYSFALELRDTGRYGFILPVEQIEPTNIETFEGLKALVTELENEV